MSETGYTEFSPYVPLTFISPTWGKVMYLEFNYTGPNPSPGSPISSYIIMSNSGGSESMLTNWANVTTGAAVPTNFAVLGACHFYYGTTVIPEFPPLTFLLLLLMATLAATMIAKRVWIIKRKG
jgi:hypothetical protein